MDRIFEFLFKYRPVVFERGELVFDVPWPLWALGLLGAAGALVAIVPYLRVHGKLGRRDRAILAGLRLAALAVLLFCLSRPLLVIAVVVPQQNFVGILLDDSRSMRIVDGGRARGAVASELFAPDGALVRGLTERFKLRFFRFGETAGRIGGADELAFDGRRTDLGRALDAARAELASLPLAGLVLVTDGAHNAAGSTTDPVLALQAGGVPVHVVALGHQRPEQDLEVARADVSRTVLAGSSVVAELTIAHAGFGGETVPVHVEADGRIVGTGEARLPREGEAATARVHFTASGSGPRKFRFVVPPQASEAIMENNALEALIEVRDRRERILYFEGEPRFEVKFLRRAVTGDENLEVVTLLRTAENKFLRLDVADSTELAAGFPKTREELFRYRGLILGSVEASFFTADQLRMIADFVARRGGGLLALGGRRAFAEGGYAGTPLADVLPVILDGGSAAEGPGFFAEVRVEPTPFGRAHPVTRLPGVGTGAAPSSSPAPPDSPGPQGGGRSGGRGRGDDDAERWSALPPLSIVNPLTRAKPGGTVLLTGRAQDGPDAYVVLAHQRYGRGRSVAFPVQDSWLWQMHAEMPLEDLTHETFWQQLLRWLVSEAPDPVTVTTSADRVEPAASVTVSAEITDSAYIGVNGAEVVATIVSPAGEEIEIPMEWTVERDGEYRAAFTPTEEGVLEIRVTARRAGATLGEGITHMEVGDVGAEYRNAGMREPLLRRIAEETGGRFYTPETVGTLPEDVSFTESGATVREERSLWDMPVLFLALLGLVAAEWGYRRRRGLA